MSCDRSEAKKVNTNITNSSRIERTLLSEKLDQISGNWDYGVTKEVEFFKDIFTPVKLVSFTDPNLKAILNKYKDGKPISLDLEWNPFLKGPTGANLFQICTSRGCLLVHRKNGEVNQEFQKFITSNQFFMKDISCDKVRIHQTFPGDIKLQICDIAVQVLRNNGKSENFEKMVKTFSQLTPTGKFKNKKISCSKWNMKLSPRQIIYAAFDAVGLYACYEEFEKYPLTFEDPDLEYIGIFQSHNKSAAQNKSQEVKKEDVEPPKQEQIIIPQQSNDIVPKEKKNPKEVASKATKDTIKPEKYALKKLLQSGEDSEIKKEKKRLGKAFNISLGGVSEIEFTKLPKFAASYIGNWNRSELNVEFTKGVMTKIDYVYSDNPNLGAKLQRIDDGNTMALQIMVGSLGQIKCIGLISICSSLGCILIRCRNGQSSDVLNTFLATHKFVFIGNPSKIKKLFEAMINETFILDVDHEKAHHLLNYQPSKTVQSRSLLISDWNIPMYSNSMVMYAANTVSHLYNFITH